MKYNIRSSDGRFRISNPNCIPIDVRIREAVVKLISNKFLGIVSFGIWIHPLNTVVNCYALCLDGFIQYKFSLNADGNLIVAEVRDRHWINLPVQPSDVITWDEFLNMIPKATCKNVFGEL